MKPRLVVFAMLIGLLIFSNQLLADVKLLIIGSTKDSGCASAIGITILCGAN